MSGLSGIALGVTRHFEEIPAGVDADVFGSMDSQTRFLSSIFQSYAVII